MYEFKTLNLIGYRSKPIANTFMKQENETNKLAIVYPGKGYTCHMPLLYYTSMILLSKGFDVLWVQYDYGKNSEIQTLPEARQTDWIGIDANAAYSLAKSQRNYEKIVLVGKSLGSAAIKAVVSSNKMPKNLKIIWFTPPLTDSELFNFVTKSCKGNSLFIAGSNDEVVNKDLLNNIQKAGAGRFIFINGANHSMEFEGKPTTKNIKALSTIMSEVSKFIRG